MTAASFQIDAVRINRYLRPEPVGVMVAACKGVMVVACVLMLSLALYDFLKDRIETAAAELKLQNDTARMVEERPVESGRKKKRNETEFAVAKNLFGDLTPKAPAAKDLTPQKAVPQTPLALVGTFIAGDVDASYAIIEDQKKKEQQDFSVNEMIFGEAKLLHIFADKVEIERNGNREFLRLDETAESGPPTEGGMPVSEFTVPNAELEQALQNLPLLLTQARAVPYFKGGQSVGLRLFAIKNGSLYEKVGLQNGDILKTINNNSLSDITQAAKLFEMLKQEKNIAVTIERNREDRVFRYQIR